MDLKHFLQDCKLTIWPDDYSVIQAQAIPPQFVAVIQDQNERTVIAKTGTTPLEYIIKEEPGWKIISFEIVLPFELVGFLAAISKVLADENISIFALSAFSTDHIMVKEDNLNLALERLFQLGCRL